MRDYATSATCGDYTIRARRRVVSGGGTAISIVTVYKENDPGVWVAKARVQGVDAMGPEDVENGILDEAVHVVRKFVMEGFMDDWWDTLSTTFDPGELEDIESPALDAEPTDEEER